MIRLQDNFIGISILCIGQSILRTGFLINQFFHYDKLEDERREKNNYCPGRKKPNNFHEQKFKNAII